MSRATARTAALATAALAFNAFVWGVSWYPFRLLHEAGLHPVWSTALIFTVALAGLLAVRPAAAQALRVPPLWLLALATGLTNMGFNWAVTIGDVVRVVLLFYLMPAWAVLLAWWLLHERPTRAALLRLGLAFVGVVIVMLPQDGRDAQTAGAPGSAWLADALALAGGFCFALTNVLLKRLAQVPDTQRMAAMFGGGVVFAALAGLVGLATGQIAGPPSPAPGWLAVGGVLALCFLASNYALQYGAARLPAGTTAVVMLTEVVFASASSVALGAAAPSLRTLVGGVLVVLAAVLAALDSRGR